MELHKTETSLDLIERARAGDRAALDQFVARDLPRLRLMIRVKQLYRAASGRGRKFSSAHTSAPTSPAEAT
jgi:hypothetical protein